jgi:hypothetical protein
VEFHCFILYQIRFSSLPPPAITTCFHVVVTKRLILHYWGGPPFQPGTSSLLDGAHREVAAPTCALDRSGGGVACCEVTAWLVLAHLFVVASPTCSPVAAVVGLVRSRLLAASARPGD